MAVARIKVDEDDETATITIKFESFDDAIEYCVDHEIVVSTN